MADNDQHDDEYKFSELDSFDEPLEDPIFDPNEPPPATEEDRPSPQKNIKRNALITIALIVLAMLLYKFVSGFFSSKHEATPQGVIATAPVTQIQPAQSIVPQQPVQNLPQEDTSLLKQKVDSIDTNQQNLQAQVSSLNEQIATTNNNLTNLSEQISKLNQMVSDLSNLVNKQSDEINLLMLRTERPKPVKHIVRPPRRQVRPSTVYYINAVIPGRAWLIGTNGSTLTVREGTKVAGYGVVKLIDSMEGRVLTSSGRTIKFSQSDS